MKTTLRTDITIEELCKGFVFNELEEKGLYGLSGTLTIQPEYQRHYIYGDGKKDVAVIQRLTSNESNGASAASEMRPCLEPRGEPRHTAGSTTSTTTGILPPNEQLCTIWRGKLGENRHATTLPGLPRQLRRDLPEGKTQSREQKPKQ